MFGDVLYHLVRGLRVIVAGSFGESLDRYLAATKNGKA